MGTINMKQQQPAQLLQFYLPGLEMAVNELLDNMNAILRTTGQAGEFRLVREDKQARAAKALDAPVQAEPEAAPVKRRFSAEARASMAEAQRKRRNAESKRKERAAKRANADTIAPVVTVAMGDNLRNATQDEILKWARRHHGIFNVDGFKAANPGVHCRNVAALCNAGTFARGAEAREYVLVAHANSNGSASKAATAEAGAN